MKISCRLFIYAVNRSQLLLAAAGAVAAAPAPTTNGVPLTSAYIGQLSGEMATNHPGLQASSARLRAAQHGTNAVRTWGDPIVKFGGVTASSRGPDLGEDGDLLYGLEQKLPLFGKARAARLRPKVMTVATIIASLLPIMWSVRTGAEVMKPLAAPVIGGMVSSLLHILIVTPVIFAGLREAQLRREAKDRAAEP